MNGLSILPKCLFFSPWAEHLICVAVTSPRLAKVGNSSSSIWSSKELERYGIDRYTPHSRRHLALRIQKASLVHDIQRACFHEVSGFKLLTLPKAFATIQTAEAAPPS